MTSRAKSTRAAKVEWLLAHEDLWRGFDVSMRNHVQRRPIVEAMKDDRLIAHSTYWADVRLDELISLARLTRRTRTSALTGEQP